MSYRPYAAPTLAQFRNSLRIRLNDTGNSHFWTDEELVAYIIESLRIWNSLTGEWKAEFSFQTIGETWYDIPSFSNSPRAYTVTSEDMFRLMEYHLLEPATGGTWTGSSQFSITDLSSALQRRRDEILQVAGLGCQNFKIPALPGNRRTLLPGTLPSGFNQALLAVPTVPSVIISGSSPPSIILQDSASGLWAMSVVSQNLQVDVVSSGTPVAPIFRDQITSQYWQLGVTPLPDGQLTLTPVAPDPGALTLLGLTTGTVSVEDGNLVVGPAVAGPDLWQITMDSAGVLHTQIVATGTPQTLVFQDLMTGAYWLLAADAVTGALFLAATGSSGAIRTFSFTQGYVSVINGVITRRLSTGYWKMYVTDDGILHTSESAPVLPDTFVLQDTVAGNFRQIAVEATGQLMTIPVPQPSLWFKPLLFSTVGGLQTSISVASGLLVTSPASAGSRTPLEVVRVRYVPVTGSTITLVKDDELNWQSYESGYLQDNLIGPSSFSVEADPPLAFDVDSPPTVPGVYDIVAKVSGAPIVPPASVLLGIPDDLAWVAKWGALADLLGAESEAQDIPRASYCQKRYLHGLEVAKFAPWIILAQINGVSSVISSVAEMDSFFAEWDSSPALAVVAAGIDFVGLAQSNGTGVLLRLVENAPVPTVDTDPIQASPDVIDVILDYAQHLAAFKQGWREISDTMPLVQGFMMRARSKNQRIPRLAELTDIRVTESKREVPVG